MTRYFLLAGGLLGALAVGAGAFAAHVLERVLDPHLLDVFNTAARYQLVHSVALVLVAVLAHQRQQRSIRIAGYAFVAGMLLFSGSLYLLALTGIRWLGAVTPLGGLSLIAGWLALAWSARGQTLEQTE